MVGKNIKLKTKTGFKHIFFTIALPVALVSFLYNKYITEFSPKEGDDIKYENLDKLKKNPNNKNDVLKFVESLPRFVLKNNYLADSKFTPISYYLSNNDVLLLKNYIIFNTLYFINNGCNLDQNFDYDFININDNSLNYLKDSNYDNYSLTTKVNLDLLSLKDNSFITNIYTNKYKVMVDISTSTYNELVTARSYNNNSEQIVLCSKLSTDSITGDKTISNCISEFEYSKIYFIDLYSNLNNTPSLVDLDTRLKVFYILSSARYLNSDSICYTSPDINNYIEYHNECIKEIELSRSKILKSNFSVNAQDRFSYLDYTNRISFSLKIPYGALDSSNGFINEYMFKEAKKLIIDKYNLDPIMDRYLIETEISKVWNTNNPSAVLNLNNYGDVFENIKNQRELKKLKLEKELRDKELERKNQEALANGNKY